MADVSVRFDGNSEFGADQRFAPFFSGGLGLNLHNYKFMKQFDWMDRLKIRGTYGITGKVDFSPYEAQTIYKVNSNECKGRVWIFLYKFKRLTGLLVSFLLCFDFWRLERSYHVKVFNI